VDIEILGPLTAQLLGKSVTPTGAKPRKVLALLAVHADEVVPVPALFEELWGDKVPRSAHTTLQTYVLQIRNLIAAATDGDPKQVLVTQPGGYLLATSGGQVDVKEFERLATVGHRFREAGDYGNASRAFTEALAIWHGPALIDVTVGPMLEVETHRLQEARLNVLDRRIDADLRLGRHHELLGELTALAARNRTHEGLCAHLMVALHRSGRRGEAVDVYRKTRACLVSQLGLEPSPALHHLQRKILAGDPRLGDETQRLQHVG
jgi:DNA-binding SARP family transcriptional activator